MADFGEFQALFTQAAIPLVHVLLGSLIGFWLAKAGILNVQGRQNLAKLSMFLFIPSLTFVKLADAMDIQLLLTCWFVPVNVLLNCVLGCLVGIVIAYVCKVSRANFRIIVSSVAMGNMGNLPLVILTAACRADEKHGLFGGDTCEPRGVAYIMLGVWAAQSLQWSIVHRLLAPPKSDEIVSSGQEETLAPQQDDCERDKVGTSEAQSFDVTMDASIAELGAEGCRKTSFAVGDSQKPPVENTSDGNLKARLTCVKGKLIVTGRAWAAWLQPPILASWAAVAVSVCPPVKGLLFGESAPLSVVTSVLGYYGDGFVPAALLTLGSSLDNGPNQGATRLSARTVTCVVVARLAVVPVLGWGLVVLMARSGILPKDPLFLFICILQHCTPAAVALNTISTYHGHGMKEMGTLLFWQYLLALPFMCATLVLNFGTISWCA